MLKMNNNSAVEWLVKQLNKHGYLGTFCDESEIDLKRIHMKTIIDLAITIEARNQDKINATKNISTNKNK